MAVLVVGIAAYAVGAGKSSSDVTLCAVNKGGELSLASHGKCGKGEKKLTIAKQGPVGPQGAQGPQGAVGPAGSAATVVPPEAVHYVTGPPTDECKANPGTFCKPSGLSFEWINGSEGAPSSDFERVGYFKDPSGFVHLVGVAQFRTGGGGSGGGFEPEGPFYLPPGYRPGHVEAFAAASNEGFDPTTLVKTSPVEIRPDGTVATMQFEYLVSLSGIVFRAG
jgi:hypothetical protein